MPFRPHIRRRSLFLVVSILIIISCGLFVRNRTSSSFDLPKHAVHHGAGKDWSSFADVSTLFVFGDSWSSLGLKVCAQYEAAEAHHFGNPDFPGVTTTNGPNWVGYLTHVFNRSVISTYDLAIPGSTVDTDVVPGMWNYDLKSAIQQFVDPVQRCQFLPETWDPTNSLFAIFFGVNDVTACNEAAKCDIYNPPTAEIFKSYTESMTALHAAGARNFLLLNAPPVSSEAALDLPWADGVAKAQARATKLFNEHHRKLAQHIQSNFDDTTVFEFDVWTLLQQVHYDPQDVPDTAIYKNVTGMCLSYGPSAWLEGKEPTQAEIDLCGGLRPEEYLWNSPLHVTWPVHKAIARGVVNVMDNYGK